LVVSRLQHVGEHVPMGKLHSAMLSALPKNASVNTAVSHLLITNLSHEECVNYLRIFFRTQEVNHLSHKEDSQVFDTYALETTSSTKLKRCFCCNKTGHIKSKCWTLHPELRPSRSNESTSVKGIASGSTSAKGKSNVKTCDYCGKPGHIARFCFKRKSEESKGVSKNKSFSKGENKSKTKGNIEVKQVGVVENSIVMDISESEAQTKRSRVQIDNASDINLTGERDALRNVTLLDKPLVIRGVNSNFPLQSKLKGEVVLLHERNDQPSSTIVKDVYYVNDFVGTILSQGIITQKGYDVHSSPCINGKPGSMKILRQGSVFLSGEQPVNSKRIYLSCELARFSSRSGAIDDSSTSSIEKSALTKTRPSECLVFELPHHDENAPELRTNGSDCSSTTLQTMNDKEHVQNSRNEETKAVEANAFLQVSENNQHGYQGTPHNHMNNCLSGIQNYTSNCISARRDTTPVFNSWNLENDCGTPNQLPVLSKYTLSYLKRNSEPLLVWHRRFGHIGKTAIIRTL